VRSLKFLPFAALLAPALPTTASAEGRAIVYEARPVRPLRSCSARVPVCVHAQTTHDGPAAIATLNAFERGWMTLVHTLGVPAPDVDPDTLAYDVFLEPGDLATTHLEARDVRSKVDRARGFTRIDPAVRAGCRLDALAASSIARASLLRVAPATEEGSAIAQAQYLAELAVPCATGLAVDAVATFQANADRAISDEHFARAFSEGASTFWRRIDWAFGRTPGTMVTTTWALHPTMTPVGESRWSNEPDTFDVLRASFNGTLSTGSTIADLWLDFAVARAFFGIADDGAHAPELRTVGEAGRVPLAWDIPWPSKPRRLAPRIPIAPTGASYVLIHREGAPAGARLRVELEWEEHALLRWALVKLARDGRELGRVVIPTRERATATQMTLASIDEADRILLVGVNTGDPAYAFDPDDDVFEPHGFLLTIAQE
jgi:hypothetical protein